MLGGNRREQVKKLLLLAVMIIFLMFFLFWSFRADDVIAGSFRLGDIQICEELDDKMMPMNAGTTLPGSAKQVCLWFDYSKARVGDSLEIIWKFDARRIQKDSFRLSESGGVRAFYLLKEDGSELPPGAYAVTIFCNGSERGGERFIVEQTSGDVDLQDETLD
ncbi:MAG: hypothetical protein LBT31_00145 [Synergistaceae bacterium]|jgi:hypothetical protein|nr:hypothetical protein [Synergistaceae bacterium]